MTFSRTPRGFEAISVSDELADELHFQPNPSWV